MSSLNINKLVEGGYLSSNPKGPESECEYISVGDLSENGHLECKKHGKWNGEQF